MAFDSSMLCARTTAGDAELATPSQGLSLGQRRVLTLLQSPAAVEELAQKHHLEPEKLARDLTRLADLRLVRLQGSAAALASPRNEPNADRSPASPASGSAKSVPSMTPVIIGRSSRRAPMLPLAAGVAAVVLALGIWYGMRGNPAPPETPQPETTPPATTATSPSAPLPAAKSTIEGAPAIATILRGNAPLPEMRPEIRPGLPPPVVASPKAAVEPAILSARAEPTPPAVTSSPAPAPAPLAAAPAAATASTPAASAAAEATPPGQLAAAAPGLAAARAPVAAELKSISRDPPDFPKEAISEGLRSGVVNARIHVDARGNVSAVDILGSQPPKVFDKAARKALMRWQFEPLATGQTANLDVDVKFQRD